MKRITSKLTVAFVVLLLFAAAAAANGQAKKPQLPQVSAATPWILEFGVGGGFTGQGLGRSIITADGDILYFATLRTQNPDRSKLSAERLARIDEMVRVAKPAAWRTAYEERSPDSYGRFITLTRRMEDGAIDTHTVDLPNSQEGKTTLPLDLAALEGELFAEQTKPRR